MWIGSSSNISRRLKDYYNLSYLEKSNMAIYKALLKYGYSNFSFEILEYCDQSVILKKEQDYLDLLSPDSKK
jgi:group I intron endonuclease